MTRTCISQKQFGVAILVSAALVLVSTATVKAVVLSELVADWQFNGDLTAAVGGSGLDLTFHGTNPASYVTSGGHTALALDGVDQYASLAAGGTAVDFNAQSFTISAWLTVHTVPTARREAFIVGRASSSSNDDYGLSIDYQNQHPATDDDNVIYQANGYTGNSPGAADVLTNMQGTSGLGHYINMVVTYDQPTHTLTIYRNGSNRASTTSATGPYANVSALLFGTDFAKTTFLEADLDDIQLYDASASQSDVTALYNSGNGPGPIPEPASAACLMGGALMLLSRSRRR